MKKVFLVLALLVAFVGLKFVHTRFFVENEFGPTSMLAVALMSIVLVVLVLSYLLAGGRHKDKVVGFWLVSVSIAFSYIVLDLLAGLLLITPLSPELVPDEYRHHKLVPDAYAKFQQKDFSYVQRNNSLGLRGPELDLKKPPETYRILMLGDSFTMGKGVEDNETFSALVEERLNAELAVCDSEYRQIQVLNGGVDSYAPILSYLYLTRELHKMEPDLVILNLDNSDLVQESAYRSVAVRDATGRIAGVAGRPADRSFSAKFRDWIESNLYITRLLLYYTNRLMGHKDLTVHGVVVQANAEVIAHTLESDELDRSSQWNDIFESLRLIREFGEDKQFSFVLSVYPWAHQVSQTEWTPGRFTFIEKGDTAIPDYDDRIQAMASVNGIDVISAYDAFSGYTGQDPLYFDNDPHFTVAGHRLMAHQMIKSLAAEGLVPRWCD